MHPTHIHIQFFGIFSCMMFLSIATIYLFINIQHIQFRIWTIVHPLYKYRFQIGTICMHSISLVFLCHCVCIVCLLFIAHISHRSPFIYCPYSIRWALFLVKFCQEWEHTFSLHGFVCVCVCAYHFGMNLIKKML